MERSLVFAPFARTRTKISPAKGSPVRVDWLTIAQPRSTTPSMQTGMPERTATTSPATREDAGTDLSQSPSTSCTVSGAASSE